MTRPPDFRLQPAPGRLAHSSLLALRAATETRPTRNAPPNDRAAADATPLARSRTIPSISIHAFCEAPETSAALEAASADRRLAKASLEVSTGGVEAATADCIGDRSPNVLVVETRLP